MELGRTNMNRLFIVAVLIISCQFTYGQLFYGVMGVPFKSNQKEVIAAMKTKGAKLNIDHSTEDFQVYQDVNFAGYKALITAFGFYKESMFTCSIIISPDYESKMLTLYESIADELTEKYGKPESFEEEYRYPFKKGDDNFSTALKGGYIDLSKKWKVDLGDKSFYITVRAQPQMSVKLQYEDALMADAAQRALKANQKKDF